MPGFFLTVVLLTLAGPKSGFECGLTEPDVIDVDGMLDDWEGVGAAGTKISLRCNYDADSLYLALRMTGKPAPTTVKLAGATLVIEPNRAGTKAKLGGALGKRGAEAAVSLQPGGWSAEVKLPLDPWRSTFAVPVAVSVKGGSAMAPMVLTFQEKNALYKQAKSDLKLKGAAKIDTLADLDGEPGLERVLAGKNVIAAIGDEYAYFQIPVRATTDIRELRLVELDPRGRASILVHYVERGTRGSREVLAVYDLTSRGWNRTFAHEVAKELDANRLTNTFRLAPRKKKGGQELIIEVGECVGFTQESWRELPAGDMQPILLPWGESTKTSWVFEDFQSFQQN